MPAEPAPANVRNLPNAIAAAHLELGRLHAAALPLHG